MKEKIRITLPSIGDEEIDLEVISKWNVTVKQNFGGTYFCSNLNSNVLFSISEDDYRRVFGNKSSGYRALPEEVTIKRSEFLSKITGMNELGLFAHCDIEKGTKWMTHVKTDDPNFEDGLIRLPIGGFFNHDSKNPNCNVIHEDNYIYFETNRDVSEGEELTAKYILYDPEA